MITNPTKEHASIVGCYVMHLYCALHCASRCLSPRKEYTGPNESNCRAQARKDGWSIKGNRATCPSCSGKRVRS